MTNPRSVRHELKMEMVRQGYTLSSFSKVSGINRGVLSSTLNDSPTKSLSMNQLNTMNEALGFPVGSWYERYTEELVADMEHVSWRKVKDLLTHCVYLQKSDLIERVLNVLKNNGTYVNYIFEFAEELTGQSSSFDLCRFYQYVVDHESNLHAERFAVSQYRLFRANLGLDLRQSFKAMVQFTSYRNGLPLHLKLDALAQLIHVSFSIKDWNALNQYGKELVDTTILIYDKMIKNPQSHIVSYERPLVLYYGKGYVAQFAALEYSNKYDEAKKIISNFEDLSWFYGLDTLGKIYVERYSIVAKCNKYNIELLQGNDSVLKSYMNYLELLPEEQPASLEVIIKASNLHYWNIDDILDKYHDVIYPPDILQYLETMTDYYKSAQINRYINIYHDLAIYYFERKKSSDTLEQILSTLQLNIEKYNSIHTFDSTELFEKLHKFYF